MKWTLISIGLHAAVFGCLAFGSNLPFGREKSRFIRVGMVSGTRMTGTPMGTGVETTSPTESEVSSRSNHPAGKKLTSTALKKHANSDTTHSSRRSGGSGGGSRITVDGPVGSSGYYLEIIRRRVESNWAPPASTGSFVAGVRFEIRSGGRIEDVSLEKPSGRLLFDQAAQRAVLSAGQFPPLPGELGDRLTVHIEFEPVWPR
jgi:TonB family protein